MIGLNHEEDEEEEEIKDNNKEMRNKRRNGMMPRHSVHFNLVPKGEISYLSNNGFNSDMRKYYPLTISRHYFIHSVIFTCLLCALQPRNTDLLPLRGRESRPSSQEHL